LGSGPRRGPLHGLPVWLRVLHWVVRLPEVYRQSTRGEDWYVGTLLQYSS
jgi:hypothetical protein